MIIQALKLQDQTGRGLADGVFDRKKKSDNLKRGGVFGRKNDADNPSSLNYNLFLLPGGVYPFNEDGKRAGWAGGWGRGWVKIKQPHISVRLFE